jgi:hypothetical protein
MVTMHRHGNWKIAVYGAEHGMPHFHVEGPDFRCSLAIATNELIIGEAPARSWRRPEPGRRRTALSWRPNGKS